MKDTEDYIQDQYDTMKNIALEHEAFRVRLSALRQQIKEDTSAIRQLKAECHQRQVAGAGAPEQSRLARLRKEARVHHLLSGFLRGRSWGDMEANHADGDLTAIPILVNYWNRQINPDAVLEVPAKLQTLMGASCPLKGHPRFKLITLEHIRCDEFEGESRCWVPYHWSLSKITREVQKAQTKYLTTLQEFIARPAPNDYRPYGEPNYSAYPDKKVSEVQIMWAAKREEYQAWMAANEKARKPFSYYLKQQGIYLLHEYENGRVVINWGHHHGWQIELPSDADFDLPGADPSQMVASDG